MNEQGTTKYIATICHNKISFTLNEQGTILEQRNKFSGQKTRGGNHSKIPDIFLTNPQENPKIQKIPKPERNSKEVPSGSETTLGDPINPKNKV